MLEQAGMDLLVPRCGKPTETVANSNMADRDRFAVHLKCPFVEFNRHTDAVPCEWAVRCVIVMCLQGSGKGVDHPDRFTLVIIFLELGSLPDDGCHLLTSEAWIDLHQQGCQP